MEEEGGGFRLSKKSSDKGGEVDYKTKAGTAWSHSFLNQKPWHPLSYPNQRRKWIAEQTHSQKQRRAEEVAREYAQEQEFLRQTALISKKEKEKPLKWELKQKPGMSPPRGGFDPDDPNQQIVAEDIFDEYGGFLGEANIPELLTNFSSSKTNKKSSKSKHRRRQSSPASDEIRDDQGSGSSSDDDRRKSKSKKRHKRKKRKHSETSSSESSDDNRHKKRRNRHKHRHSSSSDASDSDELHRSRHNRGHRHCHRHRDRHRHRHHDRHHDSGSSD
ncbi:UNVERIFIED_CONTAM: putative zinc finger CCHC domain-containing protein [Sesamum angustifolium]|uniref:Zinc finger CCHC domain-containing protein n=1 Tax=Sesamum angustifolium TaxID=2727405 RepID=A0AAW2M923_9LAMI